MYKFVRSFAHIYTHIHLYIICALVWFPFSTTNCSRNASRGFQRRQQLLTLKSALLVNGNVTQINCLRVTFFYSNTLVNTHTHVYTYMLGSQQCTFSIFILIFRRKMYNRSKRARDIKLIKSYAQ